MENIRIAHLSDLHFGVADHELKLWRRLCGHRATAFKRYQKMIHFSKKETEIWTSLRNFLNEKIKPHLILVTGDVVDTPDFDLYTRAETELESLVTAGDDEKRYFVCPGNHDSHWRGNALGPVATPLTWFIRWKNVPAWFDRIFGGKLPRVDRPFDVHISDTDHTNEWRVRVIALDTSGKAMYSAQGFVDKEHISKLAKTALSATEFDLVVLMHHHHLLPIAELERDNQSWRGLFSATIMLNSGTVLEQLAEGQVNIVLHGHEHHPTFSRFGALRGQQSEVVIVGAGSATGNKTLDGFSFDRASFNLIELRPDRSVTLQEIRYKDDKWIGQPEPIVLLDGRAIRRARLYRGIKRTLVSGNQICNPNLITTSGTDQPRTAKIVTCLQFKRDRTIEFRRDFINWLVEDGGSWNSYTMNSSGLPSPARVEFFWPDSEPEVYESIRPEPCPTSRGHTYRYGVKLKEEGPRRAHRISIAYEWQGGAVLAHEDWRFLNTTMLGDFRCHGLEFATTAVNNELEGLSLMVRLPARLAPPKENVGVYVDRGDGRKPEKSIELSQLITHHSAGLFSIDVPYPEKDRLYVLAWNPRSEPHVNVSTVEKFWSFARSSQENAQNLIQLFAALLQSHSFVDPISLALYLPTDNTTLELVSKIVPDGLTSALHPPGQLSLVGNVNLYRLAWWGRIQAAFSTGDIVDQQSGFLKGERALLVVPILQTYQQVSVCCGLIRVGIPCESSRESGKILENELGVSKQDVFFHGAQALLHKALQA